MIYCDKCRCGIPMSEHECVVKDHLSDDPRDALWDVVQMHEKAMDEIASLREKLEIAQSYIVQMTFCNSMETVDEVAREALEKIR